MGQFFTYETKENPNEALKSMQNERLHYIQKKFLFTAQEIINFHKIFRAIDRHGNGHINIENLYHFLDEELNSIISPYLEYFFQLIDKEVDDKITFTEWLPAISVYCLYSQESVISFVFRMLDIDHDSFISKKDMMVFLVSERFGQKIFPYNYVKAIDYLELDRPHKITLDQFKRFQSQIPFICYPALRIQQTLRYKIFGRNFWNELYDRLLKQENEENKLKQLDKITDQIKKKQQSNVDKKVETILKKTQNLTKPQFLKNDRIIRRKGIKRAHSDSRIGLIEESQDDLIQSVYNQQKRLLSSSQSPDLKKKRKQNQIKQLHAGSKSEIYIKQELKIDKKMTTHNLSQNKNPGSRKFVAFNNQRTQGQQVEKKK